MRNPDRIPQILSALEYVLKQKPEMTIGKILILLGGDPAVYYIEDYGFIKTICERLDTDLVPVLTLENETLVKLAKIWIKFSDLRLGQLICNVVRGADLDNIDDKTLVDILENYYGELK